MCFVNKANDFKKGHVLGGNGELFFHSFPLWDLCLRAYYWGCARGFGRGTLYMKWGQQNQRFGTMRLRGEKMKNEKNRKREKM